MPAITQPRTVTPWTGMRYGSFAAKFAQQTPDFMHGVLVAFVYLGGEMTAQPHVIGGVEAYPALQGRIEVNP